ncbi:hypothetical [Prochlorococcus marinus str. MIT 9313]|uniref:Uncharacterized protein n=1 Tax=Prochlorococcus marinus (strain MIT 9313) TaxID=74547 RepID=Q7V4R9_PROMM|nr:hypothetical protein [Prochlorococcus marinus]CAE22051.1 hypothetical [Prochlorococcus marinus str. MIT 9313]
MGTLENKGGTINNQGVLFCTYAPHFPEASGSVDGGKIYLYDSGTLNNNAWLCIKARSRLDIDASSTLNNLSFLQIIGDEGGGTLDNNGGTVNNKCGDTPPGEDDDFGGLKVYAGKLNINNGGKLYSYGSSTIKTGSE